MTPEKDPKQKKYKLKLSFSGFRSMKKRFLVVESSLEHISKLKHLKSEAEMLIFYCFYKQNVIYPLSAYINAYFGWKMT